eukprot:CAMPEP_0182551670 /NCGR_PEP_ID=MMETSP1323-20130603/45775_1 /TAXON_ID=236787 /ORGANISM="Florenciella parvula, Strain RCC1693" /LENGTH=91 /DNA_ID=CAMNT_0024763291 /DNA_START=40 /DNA_END=312 /DNA_ORIENTATION=+
MSMASSALKKVSVCISVSSSSGVRALRAPCFVYFAMSLAHARRCRPASSTSARMSASLIGPSESSHDGWCSMIRAEGYERRWPGSPAAKST